MRGAVKFGQVSSEQIKILKTYGVKTELHNTGI